MPRLVLLFAVCGLGLLCPSQAQPPPLITTCAEARGLDRTVAAQALPVKIQAVVTFAYPNPDYGLVIQDETAGIYVSRPARREGLPELRAGLRVEIEGVTGPGHFAPSISATAIKVLGSAELPAALSVPLADLLSGRWDCRRVKVNAVVQHVELRKQVEEVRLELAEPGGRYIAYILDGAGVDPAALEDAEVEIEAPCFTFFNRRGQAAGIRLQTENIRAVKITKPPPAAGLFSLPPTPMERLLSFSPEAPNLHRISVIGTVALCRPGKFLYLHDGPHALRVTTQDQTVYQPGERVEAAGFAEFGEYYGELRQAVLRRLGAAPQAEPIPASLPRLLSLGASPEKRITGEDFDGRLITVKGRLDKVELSADDGVRVWLDCEGHAVSSTFGPNAPLSHFAVLRRGSEVELTGICVVRLSAAWPARDFSQPIGLRLLSRSPADLRVLRAASWWTPERLALALMVTGGVLVGSAVWIGMLRRRVRLRTAQLAEEMRARRDASVEFEATQRERNRLAIDLHDTVAQALTGLAFQLEATDLHRLTEPASSAEHLALAAQIVERSREEIRRSVWNLRAQVLDGRTLTEALGLLLRRAVEGRALQTRLEAAPEPEGLPEFVAGNILLLAQEALTNAVRHAQARTLTVRLVFHRDEIVLEIEDDGVGFHWQVAPGPATGHFGLQGMRERVKRLGGSITIQSAPGAGAIVRMTLRAHECDALVGV